MSAAGFRVSQHARLRAREMGVPLHEVIEAASSPETAYPSLRYPGARTATRGRLAVAYDPERRTVITVLWNREEGR